MSFNPKAKTLAAIEQKEVNKKAIDKLGAKFNPTTGKKAPFFIKTDHKYADGTEAPLFIFGKIKQFKAAIKDLKGNTELHGLAYVEYDDKQVTTLCLAPTKGKLDGKEVLLKKAMKDTFTAAYAQYKLLPPLTEEEAAAAEAAMEAMADEEATAETAPNPVAQQQPQIGNLAGYSKRIQDNLAKYKAGDKAVVGAMKADIAKFQEAFAKALPNEKTQYQKQAEQMSSLAQQLDKATSGAAATAAISPEKQKAKTDNKALKGRLDQLLANFDLNQFK
jgi:hypothetical protein